MPEIMCLILTEQDFLHTTDNHVLLFCRVRLNPVRFDRVGIKTEELYKESPALLNPNISILL